MTDPAVDVDEVEDGRPEHYIAYQARLIERYRSEVAALRAAILPVLTLPVRAKGIALPLEMRDALREAFYFKQST